ncbi:MAG: M56 family metallopeptidase, partial [Acetatifactor sp.]|nr:M56 family metallopeptidase [Acetatifactor sp.]
GVLEASVVGGICIILFFLVSQLFGERYRANYKKVIWLLIALRLCIPVSLSLFPKPVTVHMPVYVLGERGNAQMPEEISEKPTDGAQITAEIPEDEITGNTGTIITRRQLTSQDVLAILWGIGSVGVLLYCLLGHFIFCRRMRNKSRECADERILIITAKTAEELGLKKIPQVRLTTDTRTGPFTVGFLHNMVFLPDTDYQEKDLQYIIRHELAHCAGKDTQMKTLFIIVNAIHWFNPLVWFMTSLVDQDMELACDERVLEDTSRKERSEYGELLMSCIGTDKADRSAISTGYVQGVKFIKKRFRNIFNTQKKSGKVIGCIIMLLLVTVSGMIGFEAGRIVYAKSKIAIDSGIELRTDVTGDGENDRVWVRDDTYTLITSVGLQTADGRDLQYDYDDETWAASYLVSGDLSGNGAADIVVMRNSNGMHGTGPVSVLHVTEEVGELRWQEYSNAFIPNPSIDWEQPRSFEDIECVGATIIEDNGRHFLRLIALDMEILDDNTVQYIDCSLQKDGWFIEDIQTTVLYPQHADRSEAEPEQLSQDILGTPASAESEESQVPEEIEELRQIVVDFYEGYFGGDIDSIKPYLTEPFDWDLEVYDNPADGVEISAIKGLENAEGKSVGEVCVVWVEFSEPNADNYFYLTIEFIRTEQGWRIYFYGIEG